MSAGKELRPGVRVRITAGASQGRECVVVARWESLFGGKVRQWRLSPTAADDVVRDRVIREDFLEVLS